MCVCVCIAHSYRPDGLAGSVEECYPCVGGYMCNSTGVVTPVACSAGTYCPLGSSLSQPCPASYSCPPSTALPLPCPPSYYCPAGSAYPSFCPDLHYCPALSAVPLLCPLGYRALNDTSNTSRSALASACRVCGPGFYTEVRTRMCAIFVTGKGNT